MVTPVPFIQPLNAKQIDPTNALVTNIYGSQNIKTGAATTMSEGTGMFPYQYTAVVSGQTVKEGFIDTTYEDTPHICEVVPLNIVEWL